MIEQKSQVKAWYIVFMNAFVGCSFGAAFPQFTMTVGDLAAKSGIPESILLASDTVKSVGIVAGMMVAGFLYNKFGPKTIFIYSFVVGLGLQILILYVSQVWLLMFLKFIQGTASIVFPVFLTLIMDWIIEKNLGLATAIFNGLFYAGGGIGGTFAGYLIAKSGWEMSYYIMTAFQLAVAIFWLITVDTKRQAPAHKEEVSVSKDGPKQNLLLKPKTWLLAISLFATTWTVQAITVDMPLFSGSLGFDTIDTGKILTAVSIGMVVSCLVSGKMSDFFAARTQRKDIARIMVLVFGYAVVILSVLIMAFADMTNFNLLYAITLIFTFGASWGLGAFYSILPEMYDEKTVPIVTGISGGMGDTGMPLAPLVVGVVFGINGMWTIGWGSCAVLALVSSLSAVILIITLKKQEITKVKEANFA